MERRWERSALFVDTSMTSLVFNSAESSMKTESEALELVKRSLLAPLGIWAVEGLHSGFTLIKYGLLIGFFTTKVRLVSRAR